MDESTTGKRLRRAIEEGPEGFSVRGFQRAMEARLKDLDVRGYTYPSINSYLHDETSPSVAFLEQAADVLGVRLAYLAANDGPMIDPEPISEFRADLFRGLRAAASSGSHPWESAMEEVVRRLKGVQPVFPLDAEGLGAEDVGAALRGPLNALDIEPDHMTYDALGDYAFSMVPVLLALVPEHERQNLHRYSKEETDG